MFNSKIFKTSLIALVIYLLLNFFFFSKTWRIASPSEVIAFSPNSKMIAVASGEPKTYNGPNHSINGASSTVEIRKIFNGKVIQTLDFPAATSLAFSPDNKLLATGNHGKNIQVWRISDGQLVHSVEKANPYIGQTRLLDFTPDGNTLIASSGKYSRVDDISNEISAWDLNTGSKHYTHSKLFSCAAVSTNKQLLAFGGRTEPLTVYQLEDGTSLRSIADKPGICSNLEFSANGKLLIFLSLLSERNANIYSLEENKLLHKFVIQHRNDRHYFSDTAISSNSKYLAVSYIIDSYGDGFLIPSYPKAFFSRIRIWNIENGRLIKTIVGHRKGINAIAFSPDGKWLASAGKDSTIKFWRMPPRNYWIWLLAAGGLAVLVYYYSDRSFDTKRSRIDFFRRITRMFENG